MPDAAPLLVVDDLQAFYGDFQALFGVSLELGAGQVMAIVGANGAGKSTLLKTIAGALPCRPEAVRFDGAAIGGQPAHRTVARGISLVPEGRRLFPSLSADENLRIGGQIGRSGRWTLDSVYDLFPALADRRDTPATALSGGQQQMVAIGRALMANPRLLLCDEISLGLAPIVVRDIYAKLPAIVGRDTSVILVEQDISRALEAADHVLCLQEGRVVLSGAGGTVTREAVAAAYFGV